MLGHSLLITSAADSCLVLSRLQSVQLSGLPGGEVLAMTPETQVN